MRYCWNVVLVLSILILCPFNLMTASAERRSAVELVDIDRPLVFTLDYREGDRMTISASVHVAGPPVSVFLIKGTDSYRDWVRSEDVDIDDIKTGNASSGMNSTFLVVVNFSMMNITDFDRSIDIGDRDVYHLVIALHRYAGMPAVDILLMTTTVDYDISWEFDEKEVPLWLLPLAMLFFIAGTVLVVYYVWTRIVHIPQPPSGGPIGTGLGDRSTKSPMRGQVRRPPSRR